MARKPNYKFERLERERAKAAKKAAKAEEKRRKKGDDDTGPDRTTVLNSGLNPESD